MTPQEKALAHVEAALDQSISGTEQQLRLRKACALLRGDPEPMDEAEAKEVVMSALNSAVAAARIVGRPLGINADAVERAAQIMDESWVLR